MCPLTRPQSAPRRIPVSTYRIQFSSQFRFNDAYELLPYLHELGVTDLYSSPRFRPRRGSSHGYDVTHPSRVNSGLGTEDEFEALCERLRTYGMGLVLDVVPNHMAATHENRWWRDILEHGRASRYSEYFDILWRPQFNKGMFLLQDRILVPVLGELYGEALEAGRFHLHLEDEGLYVSYYDRQFPLDPSTYGVALGDLLPADLRSLSASIPPRSVETPEAREARYRLSADLKARVFAHYRDHLDLRRRIEARFQELTFDPRRTHDLLERQAYRLAHWAIAAQENNYRRFFDINDLVCLRVERPEVFADRHAAIIEMVRAGQVTGLRVDHVDGLRDPRKYCEDLQQAVSDGASGIYIVVEKILGHDEALPADWPISGTTGYDFLNAVNDIFLDPAGVEQIEQHYCEHTREQRHFSEIGYDGNRLVMRRLFAGELEWLTFELCRIAAQHWNARDISPAELQQALVEVTACLPVYRTYADESGPGESDRTTIVRTLDLARQRLAARQILDETFAFLRQVLLLDLPPEYEELRADCLQFFLRWQQFSGPVMAKGLEDTAFYRHNSLLSRNEVGGDPLRLHPPRDAGAFHAFLTQRARDWPHTMNATATHDTKRGEDVRARLNVLSSMPQRWAALLRTWHEENSSHRLEIGGVLVPVPAEEILIYQTLLGAWPFDASEIGLFEERISEFLRKACREAKLFSDWLQPNGEHEAALCAFAARLINAPEDNPFKRSFLPFAAEVARLGAINSLSQLLLKITAPGLPDLYQGTELWSLSLVDPDNRRPVDFAARRHALSHLREGEANDWPGLLDELTRDWRNGWIKLYLTDQALDTRRLYAELFREGSYLPLAIEGPAAGSLIAFARAHESRWSLTLVPIRPAADDPAAGLGRGVNWHDTALILPDRAPLYWKSALTPQRVEAAAGRLPVGELLEQFPVFLATSE